MSTRQLGSADIWRWPAILGLLTSIGLVSALFSDGGFGDMLAGVCLAVPVLAGVWHGWLRPRPHADAPDEADEPDFSAN